MQSCSLVRCLQASIARAARTWPLTSQRGWPAFVKYCFMASALRLIASATAWHTNPGQNPSSKSTFLSPSGALLQHSYFGPWYLTLNLLSCDQIPTDNPYLTCSGSMDLINLSNHYENVTAEPKFNKVRIDNSNVQKKRVTGVMP